MTPSKAIGGFFGLERPAGQPDRTADFGAPYELRFWNARSALAHLLGMLEAPRVWLPAYICIDAAQAAAQNNCQVMFYAVGSDLIPDSQALAPNLRSGDAVLGVDYFGARSEVLPELSRRFTDVTWIQDRAQALWPDAAPWGDHLLYSPRKVVGAPDGGVLVSRLAPIPAPSWAPDLDQSRLEPSRLRAEDPLGLRNGTWFPAYQSAEAAMTCAPRPMSQLTATVVDALDTHAMARRRRRNAATLIDRIGDAAFFSGERLLAGAPLGVPVLTPDAGTVSARMAETRIFCARHWAELPSPAADFPTEHGLAERLLTLPCDHRYDDDDMARVAETFLACR